jgi:L-ascorbate metabolism protein UlaG (beta-lactamase superfamily)
VHVTAAAQIVYVGHSTVLVELDGVRLLTDPLLRTRMLHLRRVGPVDLEPLQKPDAVLISHMHFDHLDFPSLARLGRDTRIIVPQGAGRFITRKRFTEVSELGIGQELRIGAVVVRGTPAIHDSARRPFGVRAVPMGHMIEGSRSVYFAGDTDVFDGMAELAPVDVALLPIWGWGPSIGDGHMSPKEAVDAARLVRASVAIPIHWGTYFPFQNALRGVPSFVEWPAQDFAKRVESVAPEVEVRLLHPGEKTSI